MATTADLPQVLTTAQVADALGQSLYATQEQCRQGLLPAIKLPGGGWRVRRDDLETILARTVPAALAELDQVAARGHEADVKAHHVFEAFAAVVDEADDIPDDAKARLITLLQAACDRLNGTGEVAPE